MKQVRIEGEIVAHFEEKGKKNHRSIQGQINAELKTIMDKDRSAKK